MWKFKVLLDFIVTLRSAWLYIIIQYNNNNK